MIEVRCFESLEAAQFLREEVNALNRSSARPDPFSTFEFYENYFRNDEFFPAGHGVQLWFLAAFDTGQLVGYLPLKRVTRTALGLPISTLGFLATHDTDRPHLVARAQSEQQVSAALFSYLFARRSEWSFLELQQQDDTSALFPAPAAANLRGYLVRQWPSLEHCSIPLRWGSLREYVEDLPHNFRQNLRRQMRNLLAAGDVQLLTSSDPAITPALLELYLSIEPHSWKAHAGAAIGRHPRRIDYFRGLLDARQPMQISIRVLLIDEVPVAAMISGAFLQGHYALQMVYDDRYGKLAPGSAVLLMGMRQAIEGRCTCMNLLSGFGYFKSRWLAQLTETRIAQIYKPGSVMFWRRVLGDWKRRMVTTAPVPEVPLFNPARRGVGKDAGTWHQPGGAAAPGPAGDAGARRAALLAEVRAGKGEFLSTAQLAAVMPFAEPVRAAKVAQPSLSSASMNSAAPG